MDLGGYQRFSHRLLSRLSGRVVGYAPQLSMSLQKAHMGIRPDVYMSSVLMAAVIGAGAMLLLTIMAIVLAAAGVLAVPGRFLLLALPLPILFAVGLYMGGLMTPNMVARRRAKDIEAKLPYALNYLSTMANAGATPERMFRGLAGQDLYGEVAKEAQWIDRDVRLLGMDTIGALNKAIDRSPSTKFQDLVQGLITVLTSGGAMKEYLLAKSEQFLIESRQENQRFMDSMGVMAEAFVVVVVAAPLFLIVILSVMTMFGGSATQMLTMGYLLILVMLPLSQAGFGFVIRSMTPEA